MIGLATAAFLGGLLGSPHCVGMCGPFLAACGGGARSSTGWHLGRLTTYAALGAVSGGLGSVLGFDTRIATVVAAGLVVVFSASLAGILPEPKFALPKVRSFAAWALSKRGRGARYVFGVANGLLPCGMVYAALGLAVATGSPVWGGLVMILFGVGTIPLLAALASGLERALGGGQRRRRVAALLVLITGLLAVVLRGQAT